MYMNDVHPHKHVSFISEEKTVVLKV
jgi:hypothetical protein